MKAIETGCKCVIVNSRFGNNGAIVTIGKFIGDNRSFKTSVSKDHWEVDKPLTDSWGGLAYSAPENMLRRIDDDNEEAGSWTTIEALTNWNPTKETVQ